MLGSARVLLGVLGTCPANFNHGVVDEIAPEELGGFLLVDEVEEGHALGELVEPLVADVRRVRVELEVELAKAGCDNLQSKHGAQQVGIKLLQCGANGDFNDSCKRRGLAARDALTH